MASRGSQVLYKFQPDTSIPAALMDLCTRELDLNTFKFFHKISIASKLAIF
jgi:hypothetical protein